MSDDSSGSDEEEYSDTKAPQDQTDTKYLCQHYERRCYLECPECSQFYPCRLCHNEQSNHEIDRHAVRNVKCSACDVIQNVSPACVECKIQFARYYCLICNMFDDRDRKQFHCDSCGLCRVGGRENFFHCNTCDLCLGNNIKDTHKCVEKSSKANCPVCLGDMHTSIMSLQVPSCGHLMHSQCYKKMLQHGEYRCPTCGRSTVEMSEQWKQLDREIESTPMPAEYSDSMVWVLCKDCQTVSHTKFHVLGMKCSKCNSYNTCGTSQPSGESAQRQSATPSETQDLHTDEVD